MALAGGNLGPGLLEPVTNQVGAARHAVGIEGIERQEIGVTELPALLAAAQERRIADNHIRLRPLGFRAIEIKQCIAAFDGVERAQNRIT